MTPRSGRRSTRRPAPPAAPGRTTTNAAGTSSRATPSSTTSPGRPRTLRQGGGGADVSVLIDYRALLRGGDVVTVAETADGQPLPVEVIRRLACDGPISTISSPFASSITTSFTRAAGPCNCTPDGGSPCNAPMAPSPSTASPPTASPHQPSGSTSRVPPRPSLHRRVDGSDHHQPPLARSPKSSNSPSSRYGANSP